MSWSMQKALLPVNAVGDGDMNESTKKRYRGLAENFYRERLGDLPRSPKRIADALKASAVDYRPDSFRVVRCALAFDQGEKGFKEAADRISEVKNPVTQRRSDLLAIINNKELPGGERLAAGDELKKMSGESPGKKKQKRCKNISDADFKLMLDGASLDVYAALYIGRHLGCRPVEMPTIEFEGSFAYIHGAKVTEDGLRGLSRMIDLGSEATAEKVATAVRRLNQITDGKSGRMAKIQSRIQRLTKRLWPRRKVRPTLYTLRHQMGSNLKAGELDRASVAYLMGHQSTKSVDRYGDRRFGAAAGSSPIKPAVSMDKINDLVRSNHTTSPGSGPDLDVSHMSDPFYLPKV